MLKSRVTAIFVLPVLIALGIWFLYMTITNSWGLFEEYFFMTITMVFGSLVAGASSEGGGAVAFPVMTLVFDIDPKEARDFSLAIQSVGMTAASLWIIAKRIRINKPYLVLAIIGGSIGIVVGTYFIAPYTAPAYAKMLFVSFWLSFGIVLFLINRKSKNLVKNELPSLTVAQKIEIIFVAVVGGILSGVLGNGVDICTFAYIVMKYKLSEKIATPTSVIIMASNALLGFILHQFVLQDIHEVTYNYWLVCIPVVVFGAPMGAYLINKARREFIVYLLSAIIVVQFIGAILIIKPSGQLLLFSVASFVLGILLFIALTIKRQGKVT